MKKHLLPIGTNSRWTLRSLPVEVKKFREKNSQESKVLSRKKEAQKKSRNHRERANHGFGVHFSTPFIRFERDFRLFMHVQEIKRRLTCYEANQNKFQQSFW